MLYVGNNFGYQHLIFLSLNSTIANFILILGDLFGVLLIKIFTFLFKEIFYLEQIEDF